MRAKMKVGVGIYGHNGHQIHELLAKDGLGQLVATAAFSQAKLPDALKTDTTIKHGERLDDLLSDPRVELVSLCSPRRADQAQDAIRALHAGKHVYAEKPSALSEAELDSILEAARASGKMFREMAGTAFEAPYSTMRGMVASGKIGQVVQVIAEKSYPYHAGRPQDETIDGGLICQCAVHAFRMIEQVAGVPIAAVTSMETQLGNPGRGDLRMAAAILLRLANDGLASVTANYLNPRGTGVWGDESLRILGTAGMIESTQGGQQRRLVIGEENLGIWIPEPGLDYFDAYLRTIRGIGKMPVTSEAELSPTRWAIRAKANVIS